MKIRRDGKAAEGMIWEERSGYHTKSEVKVNKSSDINELYKMLFHVQNRIYGRKNFNKGE